MSKPTCEKTLKDLLTQEQQNTDTRATKLRNLLTQEQQNTDTRATNYLK